MRMTAHAIGVLMLTVATLASAMGPRGVRERVESSLQLRGSIDVQADGRVAGYALERQAAMDPDVLRLLARAIPHWRFQAGEHRGDTRTGMQLRLVASKRADGAVTLRIVSAQFDDTEPRHNVRPDGRLPPPRYPTNALRAGLGGTVYVVGRVGRDGRLEEAVAEQVNLRFVSSDQEQAYWRGVFERAALAGARTWTFVVPEAGPLSADAYWSVRVPVDFLAPGMKPSKVGEWTAAYVPGPRKPVPWLDSTEVALGADASFAGSLHTVGSGPRLLTPLSEG